jgi:hypothetical protein
VFAPETREFSKMLNPERFSLFVGEAMLKIKYSLPKFGLTVFTLIILFSLAAMPLVKADAPAITIDPVTGSDGTLVTVDGTGFGSEATVTIDLGEHYVNITTTDTSGAFHMTFIVTDWNPQNYSLTAVQDGAPTINASAAFTLTLGAQETPSPEPTEPEATDTYEPDPYTDEPTTPAPADNSGTTIAIAAVVLVAVLVPVALLYFRGSMGGRGRRNRGYGNQDPYNQQGPYPYGGEGGGPQGYNPQQQQYQQYPQSYQNQPYQRPQGASQYGRPTSSGYGGYSRGGYSTPYSSNSQGGMGSRVCPNCRQVVRGGIRSCPYCNTPLM